MGFGDTYNQTVANNPFTEIIKTINLRLKEKRDKEERDIDFNRKLEEDAKGLAQSMGLLEKKFEYDKQLEQLKGEQTRETEREKNILETLPFDGGDSSQLINPAQGVLQQAGLGQKSNVNSISQGLPSGVVEYNGRMGKIVNVDGKNRFKPLTLNEQESVMNIQSKNKELTQQGAQEKGELKGFEEVGKKNIEGQNAAQQGVSKTRLFLRGLERSQEELEKSIPGVGKKGVVGIMNRLFAKGGTALQKFPETSAFVKEILVHANQQARDIEGGRVTDQDRAIYAKAMANAIKQPSEENSILVSNALLNLRMKGGDISKVLDEFSSSKVDLLKDIVKRTRKEVALEEKRSNDLLLRSRNQGKFVSGNEVKQNPENNEKYNRFKELMGR